MCVSCVWVCMRVRVGEAYRIKLPPELGGGGQPRLEGLHHRLIHPQCQRVPARMKWMRTRESVCCVRMMKREI